MVGDLARNTGGGIVAKHQTLFVFQNFQLEHLKTHTLS
jgi:hypothetical protein